MTISHDALSKLLFSSEILVRDLLLGLIEDEWLYSQIWSPKNGHHKVYYFLTLWRLYEEVNTRAAVHL